MATEKVDKNSLKIFIHSDLVTPESLLIIKHFILNYCSNSVFLFPIESKLLFNLGEFVIEQGLVFEVFFALTKERYLQNFAVQKTLDLLNDYDKVNFHFLNNSFAYNKDAFSLRNAILIAQCDILLLGEVLSSGLGMQLASLSLEKNKKILCCPTDFFSYGYAGTEFLINSGSATLLTPKDFDN